MNAVDNETRGEFVFSQLLPDVVRVAGKYRIRSVAKMRGKRRAGTHSVGNLLSRSPRVADAGDHAFLRELVDIVRRFGPLRRERHQPNIALGCILPALELFEIRRTDPARRMRPARTIVRRNVRTLDV